MSIFAEMYKKIKNTKNESLFIFINFFFPIIALINQIFDLQDRFLSKYYRFACLLIVFYFIIVRKKSLKLTYSVLAFLLFWFLYLFNLLIDVYFYNLLIYPENGRHHIILFTFFVTFCGSLFALTFNSISFDTNRLCSILKYFCAIVNILFLINMLQVYGTDLNTLISSRTRIVSKNDSNFDYLNPITISIYAFIYIILFYYSRKHFISILLFFICLINIIITASKGPIVSFIISYFFVFVIYKRVSFRDILFIITAVFVSFVSFNYISQFENIILFQRFNEFFVDNSAEYRKSSVISAVNQFWDNPIFGSHYFVVSDWSSPHNIFIDILISTGVLGFILFNLGLFKIYNVLKFFPPGFIFLFLFFFATIQFSGYVWSATEFWSLFLFLIVYNKNNRKYYY